MTVAALALLAQGLGTLFLAQAAEAQEVALPEAVAKLLDLPRPPAVAADPYGRYLLLVHQHGLLPLEQLSGPTLSVAGRRLDPSTGAPHAPIPYFGLTLVNNETGEQTEVALPAHVTIGYPFWSPDGSRFAFTVTTPTGVELWVGDPVHGAKRLSDAALIAAHGTPCSWMPDSREVLCRVVPESREPLTPATLAEGVSPITLAGVPSPLDRELVQHFLYSQLEFINGVTGDRRRFSRPAIVESISPSPNGQVFLVTLGSPDYSRLGSVEGWKQRIEIWDRDGRLLRTLSEQSASEPGAPKAVHWQPTAGETLVWVERHNNKERVLAQSAPFTEPTTRIYESAHRFAGIEWLEGSDLALVSEFDATHRITRSWLIDTADVNALPRRIGSRSVDAAFPALGRLIKRRADSGALVVRVQNNAIFMVGRSNARSYIERLDLESMGTERIWESEDGGYENVIDLLTPDGNLLLTHHETATTPANYRLYDLSEGSMRPLTGGVHPAPELANVQRIPLRYRREDGVELSSTLYVPAHSARQASLPLLVWAYPRRYGYGNAPVIPDSPERFPDPEQAFKLSFVLSGYAVLDDVSMPVVGNSENANDTFLEQIIANAQAALGAAANTGYTDPARVAIAGHSYGAFMVANLLAHTDLFAAGVAMSGSYNRTLTPFGFQTEHRTLWQARDTYLKMSPFLFSDQIDSPLLLVHGALDDNAGTPPTQSRQLYDAIRYNGGDAQLLMLPFEGHSYRARTSVFLTARVMLGWLDDNLGRSHRVADLAMPAADDSSINF